MSHISVGKVNPDPLPEFEIPPVAFDIALVLIFIYFVIKVIKN